MFDLFHHDINLSDLSLEINTFSTTTDHKYMLYGLDK